MRTLNDLIQYVEAEARAEGPEAVAQFEAMRAHHRLARQLAEERVRAQLTQQQLAERSGIRQSEISKIESGRANPTTGTLIALLRPLGKALAVVDAPKGRNARAPRALDTKTRRKRTTRSAASDASQRSR